MVLQKTSNDMSALRITMRILNRHQLVSQNGPSFRCMVKDVGAGCVFVLAGKGGQNLGEAEEAACLEEVLVPLGRVDQGTEGGGRQAGAAARRCPESLPCGLPFLTPPHSGPLKTSCNIAGLLLLQYGLSPQRVVKG